MSRIDEIVAEARAGMERVEPAELPLLQAEGACVIDIRNAVTRDPEGLVPGALIIDRLVLEWRLDPDCGYALPEAPARDDLVVLVCNEGYYSSLAARDLRQLGFHRATDLIGGFRAYAAVGLPVESALIVDGPE